MNKDVILAGIRQLLTFGGGFIVAKGWLDTETMLSVAGALVTIISAGWAIIVKTKDTTTVKAAETVLAAAPSPVSQTQILAAADKVKS